MPFVTTFALSITDALRSQLNSALDQLERVPLTEANLAHLERRGGVYQLFLDDELVYVGKSKSDLPGRLAKHMAKLRGREGDLVGRVTFRCVYVVEDLDSVAPEKMLIAQYREEQRALWNTNGFGNRDPGKKRDTSRVKAQHFDWQFPADLDVEVRIARPEHLRTLASVMKGVKDDLPYTFRYAKSGGAAVEIGLAVDAVPDSQSAREWMFWIAERLPATWAIVALPGYLIAYPDLEVNSLASRRGSWIKDADGRVVYKAHDPLADHLGVVNEPEDEDEGP